MNRASSGFSLVELMIAVTISLLVVLGATTVYERTRSRSTDNEAISRLQETARYAITIIEPDIRATDYFGLVKGGWQIENKANGAAPRSPAALGNPANVCGENFAVDLDTPVTADNNNFGTRPGACNGLSGWTSTAVASADTLVIRRASVCSSDPNNDGNPADSTCPAPTAGILQICSTRVGASINSNGAACPAWPAAQLGNLVANIYYVDANSAQTAGTPALRRKSLTSIGGVVQFQDQEIVSGVEDLQVQFGIQPNFAANPFNANAVATKYVNPGDPALAGAQIVAVRVWLLVRSDLAEPSFSDNATYTYADRLVATGVTGVLRDAAAAGRAFQPDSAGGNGAASQQRFRRLLMSRTIQLRNTTGN